MSQPTDLKLQPDRDTNGMATIAAFFIGFVGLFLWPFWFVGLPVSGIAIYFGRVARREETGLPSVTGLYLGYIGFALSSLCFVFNLVTLVYLLWSGHFRK